MTAQILGIVCSVITPAIYLCKKRTHFYILHIVNATLAMVQFLLLGGWTGTISRLCSVVKNSVYLGYAYKDKTAPMKFMTIFTIISAIITLLSYTGIISLLPVIAIIISGYGNWQPNYYVMCATNLVSIALSVIYSLSVGAYTMMPMFGVEVTTIIIGMVARHNKQKDTLR